MGIFSKSKTKEKEIETHKTAEALFTQNIHDENDLMQEIINEFTQNKAKMVMNVKKNEEGKEQFLQDARNYLQTYFPAYESLFDKTLDLVESYIFGYFRLTPLILDREISDIKVIAYDNIRIKKNGIRSGCDIKFRSQKEYTDFINYVATKNQISVANVNANQRFSDKTTFEDYILRFGIIMPIITGPETPYLHIRKVMKDFPEVDELVELEMMPEHIKDLLIKRFNEASMLICGASASGKTTLLNALKETVPPEESVLIVQESEELTAKRHPDTMLEHPVLSKGDSKVQYELYDIITSALIMDVERFIIGEIKGAEALHLLNASYTGHICAGTIHSESSYTALDKVTDYAKYKSNYSKIELMKMLTSFKTVVFVKDFKVTEIIAIVGWDEDKQSPLYETLYIYEEPKKESEESRTEEQVWNISID